MFAYRHAFHAGNHADVLKHITLIETLRLMQQKEAPIWVVDTHAGAGLYTLQSALVRDKAEWPTGIGRLWSRSHQAEAIHRYLDVVATFNTKKKLTHYPGSPLIARHLLRDDDRLRAFEMHPSDIGPLQTALKGEPRRLKAERKDGFQQLRALLPPTSRRGLILIDPPYEMRQDYQHVITALKEGLARFATGVYLIWYPEVARFQVDRLLRQIAGLPIQEVLHARLTVRSALKDGLGLKGSGMVVINPPYGLKAVLDQTVPELVKLLGQDRQAKGFVSQSDAKTALGQNKPGAVSVSSVRKASSS